MSYREERLSQCQTETERQNVLAILRLESKQRFDNFHAACDEFCNLATETRDYGSRDPESDWVWQNCVLCHYLQRDYVLPDTPTEWDIFADLDGAEAVAKRLTEALKKILAAVGSFKPEDTEQLLDVLEERLWRVDCSPVR